MSAWERKVFAEIERRNRAVARLTAAISEAEAEGDTRAAGQLRELLDAEQAKAEANRERARQEEAAAKLRQAHHHPSAGSVERFGKTADLDDLPRHVEELARAELRQERRD